MARYEAKICEFKQGVTFYCVQKTPETPAMYIVFILYWQ